MARERDLMVFYIGLRPPRGATVAQVTAYIETALTAERGIRHPDDPMAYFDHTSLEVGKCRKGTEV